MLIIVLIFITSMVTFLISLYFFRSKYKLEMPVERVRESAALSVDEKYTVWVDGTPVHKLKLILVSSDGKLCLNKAYTATVTEKEYANIHENDVIPIEIERICTPEKSYCSF